MPNEYYPQSQDQQILPGEERVLVPRVPYKIDASGIVPPVTIEVASRAPEHEYLTLIDMRDEQATNVHGVPPQKIDPSIKFLLIGRGMNLNEDQGFKGIREGEVFHFGRAQATATERFTEAATRAVSRNHFTVFLQDGGLTIVDNDSANQTKVTIAELKEYTDRAIPREVGSRALRQHDTSRRTDIDNEAKVSTRKNRGTLVGMEKINQFYEAMKQGTDEHMGQIAEQYEPVQGIELDGKEFYFSAPVVERGYQHIVGYVKDVEATYLEPRLFYKSRSDGGWRVTPWIHPDARYDKGESEYPVNGEYTQLTKLDESVAAMLEAIKAKYVPAADTDGGLRGLFSGYNMLARTRGADLRTEQTVRHVHGDAAEDLYYLLFVGQGLFAKQDRDAVVARLNALELPESFSPDFTRAPYREYTTQHTMIGEVHMRVYKATYEGDEFEWHIAQDTFCNAWVDRVVRPEAGVTTYGTTKEVMLLGVLNMKPLDYAKSTKGLVKGQDYHDFNGKYVDLTPLWQQTSIIKQFHHRLGNNYEPYPMDRQRHVQYEPGLGALREAWIRDGQTITGEYAYVSLSGKVKIDQGE